MKPLPPTGSQRKSVVPWPQPYGCADVPGLPQDTPFPLGRYSEAELRGEDVHRASYILRGEGHVSILFAKLADGANC